MARKLSQPLRPLGSTLARRTGRSTGKPRSRRTASLIVFGLIVNGGACREDSEPAEVLASAESTLNAVSDSTRSESTTDRADPGRTASQTPAPFAWPKRTDHPTLILELAFAGRHERIEIELYPELAPESVQHVVALARSGHYDGTTFHRVIPGFVLQGGDPNSRDRDPSNDGQGGAPIAIPDELSGAPIERGVVALASQGRPNSTSTQFFIAHGKAEALTGRYNVIGRVREGIDTVDAVAAIPTDAIGRWGPKDRPLEAVTIERILVPGPEFVHDGPP